MRIKQYQTHISATLFVLGVIQAIAFLMQDEPVFAGLGAALAIGAAVSIWFETRSTGQQARTS
jgi:uncharacterized membrane protein